MRLSLVFVVGLAMNVLGQSITNESEMPTRTVDPTPAPETTPGPSSPVLTTGILTTITSTPEETPSETTTPPIASTAAPPSGGGATCVQRCLAQSADTVGCRGGADIACVCSSETYLSVARTCFTSSGCEDTAAQEAVQHYGRACSATTSPAPTSVSTESTSRSRTNSGSLTRITTQTLAFTSGAVVSISRGVASTITSGFTTVRTGQAGDFATGGALVPTSGSDAGSSNNINAAPGMNVGHLSSFGMMMGLGVIGGVAVLVF
ncbi:hypothetical protein B0J17DRAFT_770535 [Rhizoctonia solani]|nr:hypothetical protein B0J17DRAFT_770535 [Rhizoctonia solani]